MPSSFRLGRGIRPKNLFAKYRIKLEYNFASLYANNERNVATDILGTVKYKRKENTCILYQRIKSFDQIRGQYNTNITKTTNRLHCNG